MKTPTIAPPGAAVTDTGPAPSAAEPGAFAELLSLTTARTAVAEGSQKDRPESGAASTDQDAGQAASGDQQAAPDLGEVCVAATEAIVAQLDEPVAALTAAPAGSVQIDAAVAPVGAEVSNAAPQADVAVAALSAPVGKHESVAIAQALALPVAVAAPAAATATAAPSVELPANRDAAALTVTPAPGAPLQAGPLAAAPALAAAESGQGAVASAAGMKAAPAAAAVPATAPVGAPAQTGPETVVASAEAVAATDRSVAGTVPEPARKDSVHASVVGADREAAVLKSSEAQAQPSSDQQPEPGQRQSLDRILGAVQRAVPAAVADAAAQSARPEPAIAGDQPVAVAPMPPAAAMVAPQAPGQQPLAQQPAPQGAPVASHVQAAQQPAAAAPVAHQPVLTHAATTATVERIHELVRISSLRDGTARATLQLKPAELGTVNVHLRTTADGLVATIRAQDATALSALRHAGAELQQSLQDRGINLARIELGLSSGGGSAADDSRQAAQAFADGRGSGGDRGHRENARGEISSEHQIELEPAVTTHVLPDGVLVDVRA